MRARAEITVDRSGCDVRVEVSAVPHDAEPEVGVLGTWFDDLAASAGGEPFELTELEEELAIEALGEALAADDGADAPTFD